MESITICNSCGGFLGFDGECYNAGCDQPDLFDDHVEAPPHYNKGSIECKDYIREVLGKDGFISYCQGNVIKYLHRWKHKGEAERDLGKAQVYLGWMVETQKEDNDG